MANNRINIDFGTILKRSKCINSLSESCIDTKKRYKYLENQILNKQPILSIKNSLRSYIESLCDHKNANMYFRQPLHLIQEFNKYDASCSEYILKEYTDRILPYVEDVSILNEAIQRYDLYPYQYDIIKEYASKYIIADRILNNHDKISKRFNICSEINKVKSRGLKFVTDSCCSMIDTYTIAPYAKFNLCLEEMGYLLDKEGISYDKKDLVKYTTEYFLLRSSDISDRDYKGYKTVLKENTYITENDLEYVNFILYPDKKSSKDVFDNFAPSINKQIDSFISLQSKSIKDLDACISSCLRTTNLDLKTNIDKIIWLIWDIYKSNIFESKDLEQLIKSWLECTIIRFDNDNFLSTADIDAIINKIENISDNLVSGFSDNADYCLQVSKFKDLLNEFVEKLSSLSDISYSKDNIEAIKYVNSNKEEPVPLKEFKIFKFHNLVRASLEADDYLKNKEKRLFISRKPNDIIFGESTDELYSYIGEDSKADICVAQYYLNSSCNKQYLEEACKEFNDKLLCNNMDSIRCYYMILGEVAEIHLKESCPVELNESDWDKIRESYNSSMDIYIDEFANIATCFESLSGFNNFNVENILLNTNKDSLSLEHYKVAMEALSFLDIDKDTVNLFSESFSNYRYSVVTESEYNKEINSVKRINENWKQEQSIPLYAQIEAFQILTAVLEDAPKVKKPEVNKPKVGVSSDSDKKEDNKLDKENNNDNEKSKNPFRGINLSSMKLYLEGLKSKMKNMSAKEKEVSRNMDNYFRLFVKAMKNALVSDRREAIIKGSVIPSFSRCVKYAIGLAGMGLITGNPLVPLLTAITGLAVSKRLTQKERMLLLDEIETELEVIDEEIAMAQSKNQIKKYRQLLNYKKNLQRQYQRIRYNIRIGKDILPGSSAGIKIKDK